jgi:hypothetical protein
MKRILLIIIAVLLVTFPLHAREIGYDDIRHSLGIEAETAAYMGINPGMTTAQIMAVNDNIIAIKYGSGVTLASQTANISNIASYYFISNPSTDLRPYTGKYATFNDGTKTKKVLLGLVGSNEQYDTELLLNPSFAINTDNWNAWQGTLASVVGGQIGNCCEITRSSGVYSGAYSAPYNFSGKLLKSTIYIKSGTSLNEAYAFGVTTGSGIGAKTGTSSTSWTQNTQYKTGVAINYYEIIKNTSTVGTMLFDEASCKQVLTPSATGIWFTGV